MTRSLVRRRVFAGNPASAVYGTILVAGQLAVESAARQTNSEIIGALAATLLVFWLAHAYTDSLGHAISATGSDGPSFLHALRVEWPIVESGIAPALVLAIAALAGARPATGASAALIATAVEIVGWAALACRRAGLAGSRFVVYTGGTALFGLVMIGLKYAIH